MNRATLNGAKLGRASLDEAQLQDARLYEARLQGASLVEAWLQGARLNQAQLQGASLNRARLQGAQLGEARLQGAELDWAQLQGASFFMAELQGASLQSAQLQGAELDGAQLQGASLIRVQLQGASLDQASLQGASLVEGQLQGASLHGIAAWALRVSDADFTDTLIADVDFSDEPRCTNIRTGDEACVRNQSWVQWIAFWSAMIPEGMARDAVITLLNSSIIEPAETADLRSSWTARSLPDPERVARYLGDLACDATHAPHVARGLLRQYVASDSLRGIVRDHSRPGNRIRMPAPHLRTFAVRLADPQGCLGTQGLTDYERAEIARLAAPVKPPPAPSNGPGAPSGNNQVHGSAVVG